jgi:hypothetical protein
MTNLTVIPGQDIPRASRHLEEAIDRILQPPPNADFGWRNVVVTPSDAREAEIVASGMRRQSQPVSAEALMRWFAPVNIGVKNPQTKEDFLAKCQAFAVACSEIPARFLTDQTAREAMQKFSFFPSAAEVYALLSAHANPWNLRIYALDEIAKTPPRLMAPERPDDYDEQEKAALLAEGRRWNR